MNRKLIRFIQLSIAAVHAGDAKGKAKPNTFDYDGYGVDRGQNKLWMKEIPEYNRPLGAPLGPAQNRGYLYIRKFEHVDVWLDLENERGELTWR